MELRNKYFLLRHGETIYQTEKKDILYPFPEESPICLTEKGVEQVRKSAKELSKNKIDLIFSSDIFRTRQTSKIVANELDLKVNLDKRLRDVNFGIFGGKSKEEYRAFFTNKREKFFKCPPKGENWNDVKERILDFLKEIEEKYKEKNILIISHGGTLWLLMETIKNPKNEEEFLKEKYKAFYPEVGKFLIL